MKARIAKLLAGEIKPRAEKPKPRRLGAQSRRKLLPPKPRHWWRYPREAPQEFRGAQRYGGYRAIAFRRSEGK